MGGNSSRNGGGEGPANRYQTPPPPKKKSNFMPVTLKIVKAVGKGLEEAARHYNTRKSKEFITNYNTNVPPSERINMTDEQIGSREGLATLRKVGYKTNQDINNQNKGNGGNRVVQSTTTPSATTTIAQAPTAAEVSQSSATEATDPNDPLYIKRKTKRVGRSLTILTGPTGAEGSLTLGKPSLLGR